MIAERQAKGIAKYGTTLEGNPLSLREWLQHLLEEQLDAAAYTLRAIEEIDGKNAANDGWVTWSGGNRPILSGFRFEYFTRNGELHGPMTCPEQLDWTHQGVLSDIISYRVLSK
jgi:hypothetical protein